MTADTNCHMCEEPPEVAQANEPEKKGGNAQPRSLGVHPPIIAIFALICLGGRGSSGPLKRGRLDQNANCDEKDENDRHSHRREHHRVLNEVGAHDG